MPTLHQVYVTGAIETIKINALEWLLLLKIMKLEYL
jgi:hypothetical protein